MIYTLVEWIQALKRHPKLYHSLNAAQFFVLLFLSAWVNSALFLWIYSIEDSLSVVMLFLVAWIMGAHLWVFFRSAHYNFSFVPFFGNYIFPVSFWIIFVHLLPEFPALEHWWYVALFFAIYPLVSLCMQIIPDRYTRVRMLGGYYIRGVFMLLVAMMILWVIACGVFFSGLLFEKNVFGGPYYRFEDIFFRIVLGILYAICLVITLCSIWKEHRAILVWMQRKFISLMLMGIIIFGGTPFVKQVFIDSQIHRAEHILKEYGYSKEGLMRASRVWFLEWALTSKFIQNLRDKEGTHWEKSLYQTLFDRSIIGALEGKLDASLLQARSSDATTQAARGENAKVELHSALYDSTILPHEGIIKTTVTYELQNTDRTDEQEVVYMIELPRADAAMVDLRLGLNLEMEGILAPRGAASAVYRDAIRARRDPALLEQVWPATYRLRVYPILGTQDEKTRGRQRVQYTYITPILSKESSLVLLPVMDFLNLRLTQESSIVTRLTENDKVIHQDSLTGKDMAVFARWKTLQHTFSDQFHPFRQCLQPVTLPASDQLASFIDEKDTQEVTDPKKNVVFLDISYSAGRNPLVRSVYGELIAKWKEQWIPFDVYTFNTEVYGHGHSTDGMQFWGNTDMWAVITHIENNIQHANIAIVTDDDSYETIWSQSSRDALGSIEGKGIASNKISLIRIGDRVRTLKSEVTKSVQASDGDAYHVHAISDIASIASEIFSPKQILPVCDETENVSREVLALRLYKMSSRALKFSRENAAFLQSSFAKMGRFVNQHMSLIALETEQQKKDLERYSRYDSRYDTSYENFDTYDDGNSGFLRVQSAVMENTTSLSFGENFRDQIVGGSVSTTGGPTVSTTGGSTSSPVSVGAVGYGIGILFLIVGVVQAVRHYRREMDVDVSKQEN